MHKPIDTDDPDVGLQELFRAVGSRLRRQSMHSLAPLDISPSQSRALDVLSRRGDLRLSALSEHLRIAARSATEVVDGLQDRGLVERRADPADRRATLVSVTHEGQQLLRRIRTARQKDALRFFGNLSQQDQRELRRILSSLLERDGDR